MVHLLQQQAAAYRQTTCHCCRKWHKQPIFRPRRITCCAGPSNGDGLYRCIEANHSPHSTIERSCPTNSRTVTKRAALLAGLLYVSGGSSCSAASAATSDLGEGVRNLIDIGAKSYSVWIETIVDDIQNGTNTSLIDEYRQKRHGVIKIPGLSSFSFVHGLLVGGLVILLVAADRWSGDGPQSGPQGSREQVPATAPSEEGSINPQVEAALRKFISTPEVSATFHDPEVHQALEEIRADVKNISKYKSNPKVMQAFEKLLDIENILEQL